MPVDRNLEPQDAIAIVGMWGVFPGAPAPDRFWSNILQGIDATSAVPPGRWPVDSGKVFDPRVAVPDRVYSLRGGFLSDDWLDPPVEDALIGPLDPVFHLALHVARRAWQDARTERLDCARVGVVFGNIVLPTETASSFSHEVLSHAFDGLPGLNAPAAPPTEPCNASPAGLPASVVSRALGLSGPSFTLDAACASSLYALKLAVDELQSGRLDAVLAGGVSRPDSLYTQMGFSQLRALSARGRPAPFDHRADGLVVAEGAALFVLKRLEDALEQHDRIYGIVVGAGLSNDIQGDLLAPSSEGQLRAMRMAYDMAGWSPSDVDLIECHAPGTPLGDSVEIASLKSLWSSGASWHRGQCVIGSVKSNIGHALTAAGAAGLLKVLLALRHQVLPPTANFERPAAGLDLDGSPFRVLTRPEPWPRRVPGAPRRAALSGFGFGGINAHLLIQEWVPDSRAPTRVPASAPAGTGALRVPSPDAASHPPAPGQSAILQQPRTRDQGPRTNCAAIVGLAAHFGPFEGKRAFQARILAGAGAACAAAPRNWWGIPQTDWYRRNGWDETSFAGYFLESLEFRVDDLRIPPKELAEILPQQALMLRVAAGALADARWNPDLGLRTGVLIGIGLDLNTTNYHLRWILPDRVRQWNTTRNQALGPDDVTRWIDDLRDSLTPALSASRTVGSLGGLIASRVARQFRIGGPSFTVSCDENSGIQALAIATDWLLRAELDAVVVGAVDLAGDPRAVLARERMRARWLGQPSQQARGDRAPEDREPSASDGAVCLVLKRASDAERDGDQIYALVRGVATMAGLDLETFGQPRASEVLSILETSPPCSALASVTADLGQTGAAMGLASVAKAALCLQEQVLPPAREGALWEPSLARRASVQIVPPAREGALPRTKDQGLPTKPQFWLRNRSDGPRRAAVSSSGIGGQSASVLLEECAEPEGAGSRRSIQHRDPLVARHCAIFALEGDDEAGIRARIRELRELGGESPPKDLDALAREWWRRHPSQPQLRLGRAIVCDRRESLAPMLDLAGRIRADSGSPIVAHEGGSIHIGGTELSLAGSRLAFVYPGLGSHFAGMGRELSVLWPDILRDAHTECASLRDQLDPSLWWNGELPRAFSDHRIPILANVFLGCLVTDVLRSLGVVPGAAIGYSMGETTALVALRAWTGRDDMLRSFQSRALFQADLAGPCHAARRLWGIPDSEPVDWMAGVVACSAEEFHAASAGSSRVYVLIRNTWEETVIGGRRPDVEQVVTRLGCAFFELPTVSSVHCEIGRVVHAEYRALHDRETLAPPGVTFYSGAWGCPFAVDRQSAADALTALATQPIDFPAVIERAYQDGVRVFLEVGPGGSCSRLVAQILRDRPHLALPACLPQRDSLRTLLDLLGQLIAHRLPVDLGGLYGGGPRHDEPARHQEPAGPDAAPGRRVRIEVRARAFRASGPLHHAESPVTTVEPEGSSRYFYRAQRATAEAHRAFLRLRQDLADALGKQVAWQIELAGGGSSAQVCGPAAPPESSPAGLSEPESVVAVGASREESSSPPICFDRSQCLEFAVGSIASVLGPDFAPVDAFPTRVRLPDEPLMLVDRILAIDGRPRSLQPGRVITEHVIEPDSWYLDQGKIPPGIAIEAGQADLFLSGYLGIDFETRGLGVYRLLDATVTFHRALPGPGEVIRYDIRITSFFRQGRTILFRFQFDATVGGEPLLTMRDGCAGFFTPEELAAGRGIVGASIRGRPQPGSSGGGFAPLVPVPQAHVDARALDALRRGDLAGAFGQPFDRLVLDDPLPLPAGRMALLHRVATLDATAGPVGMGLIRAEADIHPGDWFLSCHFVDDRVMPGTLMYECCLQALRIFLMRQGWVGQRGRVSFEPLPGIANRLKCRGQIVESTRVVTYEIAIKELGYRPEPFARADALILGDGRPIVEITDMALQLSGTSRHELQRLWDGILPREPGGTHAAAAPLDQQPARATGPPLFDHERILAFAVGKPSAAFGEPYRPFDEGRFIARLPGPPYQFLHRIQSGAAKPWVMAEGSSAEAEFDVAPDAWYFAADRQDRLPFAVLLEAALQACGWLAAYMGSALASAEDLKFRNLGGVARQHRAVTREAGTLTSSVRAVRITPLAGMMLQQYEFAVHAQDGLVYDGTTEFGFFPPSQLVDQVGIRNAARYALSPEERSRARSYAFPGEAPFPDVRWRMVDQIEEFVPDGGKHGLGFVRGSIRVDPEAWFFKAHFLHDPVWPGSLGLESLLQLLKVVAAERYGCGPRSVFESPALRGTHRWTYRGQIIPANRRVSVQAEITACDDRERWLQADGYLDIDGKIIYEMKGFSLRLDHV
jgi:acyl transferase domain-containing protein/3-hydroxymyristoyl/3-hydroxydecanoyl-(acyl carrier protein) dehydratase